MNYHKPKIEVLGDALLVIEQRPVQGKAIPYLSESIVFKRATNPAYDLDE